MTTLKKTAISVITVLLTLGAITVANAAGSQCQIIYGGGEVCNKEVSFNLSKFVQSPTKGGDFVHNLQVTDVHFMPGQIVSFKITVKNTGKDIIDRVSVTDSLPQFLTFVAGPGNYNNSSKILTFELENLAPNETREVVISTKVVDVNALPSNQSIVCTVNQVNANDDTGASAQDSSQLCIERQITIAPTPTPMIYAKVPVKSIPSTGPEMLPLLGLIPAGLAGFVLRKKSKLN
jgi:uncharacterized repeat protein (TIGR01451 family)